MIKPNLKRRVAILFKNGIYGSLGVYSLEGHLHAVCNYDPRQTPDRQFYRASLETRSQAFERFDESVAASHGRGWTVIYNGEVNQG